MCVTVHGKGYQCKCRDGYNGPHCESKFIEDSLNLGLRYHLQAKSKHLEFEVIKVLSI